MTFYSANFLAKCQPVIAENCHYQGNKNLPSCETKPPTNFNVTFTSTLPANLDWNSILEKAVVKNAGDQGAKVWQQLITTTKKVNGVTVFDPTKLKVTNVSGYKINTFPENLSTDTLSKTQQQMLNELKTNNNIFFHTFSSTANVIVSNNYVPLMSSVLNHAYKIPNNTNLQSIFTVLGNTDSLPINFLNTPSPPQSFGKCINTKTNDDCVVTIGTDDEINISLQYSDITPGPALNPVIFKNETENNSYYGDQIYLPANCLIKYINNNGTNQIGNYQLSGNYECLGNVNSKCISKYFSYLDDFFNSNPLSCITNNVQLLGLKYSSIQFDSDSCKKCLQNTNLIETMVDRKVVNKVGNIYLESQGVYAIMAGSCYKQCLVQYCNN